VAFGVGALLLLFSLFSLPTIIFSPQKFTSFFTFSMIAFLTGLAFMNGPRTYLMKITSKKSMVQTAVLFGSMLLSLYFSIISGSYLLSLLFCFLEVSLILSITPLSLPIVQCCHVVLLQPFPSGQPANQVCRQQCGLYARSLHEVTVSLLMLCFNNL
jgi:hypothetical protein